MVVCPTGNSLNFNAARNKLPLMLKSTRNRLKFLSVFLSIGFLLLSLGLIAYLFIYPVGFAFLFLVLVLLLSIVFLVFSLLTMKNLKQEDPVEIRSMFVFTLIAVGFQCLYFNDGTFEWLGFVLLLLIIGVGIKVCNAVVMLEIVNWVAFSFLCALIWFFVNFLIF